MKAFFASTLGKVITALLAVAVVGGGIAAAVMLGGDDEALDVGATTTSDVSTTEPTTVEITTEATTEESTTEATTAATTVSATTTGITKATTTTKKTTATQKTNTTKASGIDIKKYMDSNGKFTVKGTALAEILDCPTCEPTDISKNAGKSSALVVIDGANDEVLQVILYNSKFSFFSVRVGDKIGRIDYENPCFENKYFPVYTDDDGIVFSANGNQSKVHLGAKGYGDSLSGFSDVTVNKLTIMSNSSVE